MSKHDDQTSLKDMLSHAREAVELLGSASREELGRNRVMQLALTRLVEIIGEAANRVSQATQQKTCLR
ncbi:MAG: HepT-like ribonuclease domain-containing protein [Anaerolineae bacterium]